MFKNSFAHNVTIQKDAIYIPLFGTRINILGASPGYMKINIILETSAFKDVITSLLYRFVSMVASYSPVFSEDSVYNGSTTLYSVIDGEGGNGFNFITGDDAFPDGVDNYNQLIYPPNSTGINLLKAGARVTRIALSLQTNVQSIYKLNF